MAKLYGISEAAELCFTTPWQIKDWERRGLIPAPAQRVQKGKRVGDRRYTLLEIEEIRRLRTLYHVGAPTMEEQQERERRQTVFLAPKP